MIRSLPFQSISAEDIRALMGREVREDHTLDYKRELHLADRDARSDILKDIVAFANASGGTLLYGVVEGVGEAEGLIVALPGLELAPDAAHRALDNLLRDGVDERIFGVLHRAVSRDDGKYYYVIRVPSSPLAPHMVTFGPHRSKFFLRANTTNDPMNSRQIKELALRTSSAEERAESFAGARRDKLIDHAARRVGLGEDGGQYPTAQVILHVVPLFASRGGWEFANDAVRDRLQQVPALGYNQAYRSSRLSQEGMISELPGVRHVAFFRNGAIEFQRYDVMIRHDAPPGPAIRAWDIEQSIVLALDECAALTSDALLPLPLSVSLTLSGTAGSMLLPNEWWSGNGKTISEDRVLLTPLLISSWGTDADWQLRSLFDEMYQAWGYARSTNYEAGERIWWGDAGRVTAPMFRFGAAAG